MTPMEHLLFRIVAWVLAVGHVVGLIVLLRINLVLSQILAYLNLRDRIGYQDRGIKWQKITRWAARALFVLESGWPASDSDLRDAIKDSEDSDLPAGKCSDCGCTDDDCSGCIEKSGAPCYWVEPNLCSVCAYQRLAHRDPRGISSEAFDMLLRHDKVLLRTVLGGNRPPSDKHPERDEAPTGLLDSDDALWIPEPGDPPVHPGDLRLFSDKPPGDFIPFEVAMEQMNREARLARELGFVVARDDKIRKMLAAEAARQQCRDVAQVIIMEPPAPTPETSGSTTPITHRRERLASELQAILARVIRTLEIAHLMDATRFQWCAPHHVRSVRLRLPDRAGPIGTQTTKIRWPPYWVVRRFPLRPRSIDNAFILIPDPVHRRWHGLGYSYEQLAWDLRHVDYHRFISPEPAREVTPELPRPKPRLWMVCEHGSDDQQCCVDCYRQAMQQEQLMGEDHAGRICELLNQLCFRDAMDENGLIDTVYVTAGRCELAVITYDSTWNCYVVDGFERGTVWSAECMHAIAEKLDELNEGIA